MVILNIGYCNNWEVWLLEIWELWTLGIWKLEEIVEIGYCGTRELLKLGIVEFRNSGNQLLWE